jgi:predicted DNA binding CopG/RHH family protein
MNTKKNKIRYGTKDHLSEEDFLPENIKQRISIFLDMDVLEKVKAQAQKEGLKYQTYINQMLRKLTSDRPSLEERMQRIEQTLFKKAK